jgi:hypothetical protein
MTRTILMAAALALAATLPAMPAQAQSNHTFVSAAGSDSNNCASVTTPCRHFANAYAVTAPNGEIDVLDPANYGALTITGPVSIEGHGWASIAAVSGSPAITINANTGDKINIIGVVLDGIAIANTNGIAFNSGGTLTVRDSVIRNFSNDGILVDTDTSNPTHVFVSNTLVSDNGGDGINFSSGGTGATAGILSHVEMANNVGNGLTVTNASGPVSSVNVTVSDSVSTNNAADGIAATPTGGATMQIMVRNSTIANNSLNGLEANDHNAGILTQGGATIRVTRSTITGNGAGWFIGNSGSVVSYGDNNIDGNTSVNTEPPGPLTYK